MLSDFATFDEAYHATLLMLRDTPDHEDAGYKELWAHGFMLLNPEQNRVNSAARAVDYDYADAFVDYMLSGRGIFEQKRALDQLEAIKPGSTNFAPDNPAASYPGKIAQQMEPLLAQLRAERDGETGAGGAGRRGVLHILEHIDRFRDDAPSTVEYPCTLALHFMVRVGKLITVTSMRSNHVPSVLCYDVYNFTAIQAHLAGVLGIDPGAYCHLMNSAHMFARDADVVDATLKERYGDRD